MYVIGYLDTVPKTAPSAPPERVGRDAEAGMCFQIYWVWICYWETTLGKSMHMKGWDTRPLSDKSQAKRDPVSGGPYRANWPREAGLSMDSVWNLVCESKVLPFKIAEPASQDSCQATHTVNWMNTLSFLTFRHVCKRQSFTSMWTCKHCTASHRNPAAVFPLLRSGYLDKQEYR